MENLKVKTSELLAIRDEATQLLSKEKLSFLAKFKITDVHKELVSRLETFEKVRKEMVEKYGELDEKKENYSIPEEKQKEFTAEIETLLEAEIEFSYEPLDISLIGNLETDKVYYQVFKLFKG